VRNLSQVEHTANGYGGAGIFAMEGVTVSLSGAASVRNNRANQCGGGGIRITHDSTLLLSGAAEVSGNLGDMGGGVFAEHKTTIRITGDVRFERNVADPNGGGAIFISGCASFSCAHKQHCRLMLLYGFIFRLHTTPSFSESLEPTLTSARAGTACIGPPNQAVVRSTSPSSAT
jgi:hypothetical protein